jgi:hypothetical protein
MGDVVTTSTAARTSTPEMPRRIWTVTTINGQDVIGYLPPWAEDDPSRTGVPVEQLGKVLADICHSTEFSGQGIRVSLTDAPGTDTVILGGSIDFHPYTDNPDLPVAAAGVPVAHLQIVDDYWIHDLDPWALGVIAAKLRAQADRLDHEVRPALTAARADWAAQAT